MTRYSNYETDTLWDEVGNDGERYIELYSRYENPLDFWQKVRDTGRPTTGVRFLMKQAGWVDPTPRAPRAPRNPLVALVAAYRHLTDDQLAQAHELIVIERDVRKAQERKSHVLTA